MVHNGKRLGLAGYRAMLERDIAAIPDLRFDARILFSQAPYVACRLQFDCTPTGTFLNLDVDGQRIVFAENVFYELRDQKIVEVWSLIDKSGIEGQLRS